MRQNLTNDQQLSQHVIIWLRNYQQACLTHHWLRFWSLVKFKIRLFNHLIKIVITREVPPSMSDSCQPYNGKNSSVPRSAEGSGKALRNFFQHFAEVCSTSPFPFNVHLLHIILQKDYFSPIRTSSRSGHPQNRVPIRTHPDPDSISARYVLLFVVYEFN